MDGDLKKKWLAALRSGDYRQARGWLKIRDGGVVSHCCLGVLCEVAGVEGRDRETEEPSVTTTDFGNDATMLLTVELLERVGMSNSTQMTLSAMNDGESGEAPTSFTKIADYIEEHVL